MGCAQLGADVSKHGGPAYEGWVPNSYEHFVEPTKGSLTNDKMGVQNGNGTLHEKVRWSSHRSPTVIVYKI